MHRHKRCIVNQREIGPDALSFGDALKAALRQDPDIILVGEMRDMETISTALTAAETGHLVFATLHTQSASSTVDRIIDVFPAEQQEQVRIMIANSLQAVVTQALLPTSDGQGRVAALEILLPDDAVRNLIRQAKIEQVYSIMQTNTARGMQTMEQALADLTLRRVVNVEDAFAHTNRRDILAGILERSGYGRSRRHGRARAQCAAPAAAVGSGPARRRRRSMSDSIWKKDLSFKRKKSDELPETADSLRVKELAFQHKLAEAAPVAPSTVVARPAQAVAPEPAKKQSI